MPSKPPSSFTLFALKRHTVTLFCSLLLLQLLFLAFRTYQLCEVLKEQRLRSHFRGIAITFGLFSLIPLTGLAGALGRFRLATIVFLFSLMLIQLPVFGFFLVTGFLIGGLKGMFTSQAGWHFIFGTVGGMVTLVVGTFYLVDLVKEARRKAVMKEAEQGEWK